MFISTKNAHFKQCLHASCSHNNDNIRINNTLISNNNFLFQEAQHSSYMLFYLSCHIAYSTEICGGVQSHTLQAHNTFLPNDFIQIQYSPYLGVNLNE